MTRKGERRLELSAAKKRVIWLIWLVTIPVGFVVTFQWMPPSGSFVDWLPYLFMMCIIAFFPIVVNGTTIFFIQLISLPTLLVHGLFVEMLLVQLATILLMFRLRIRPEELYRLPLNSAMFFSISLLSAVVYISLGGQVGTEERLTTLTYILLLVYMFIYAITNQVLLNIVVRWMHGVKRPFVGKDFVWEMVSTLLVYPLGLVVYFLLSEVGPWSIFLIGVPFICVALLLKMYNNTENINDYLQNAAEFGHELAQSLKVTEVLDVFMQKISTLLPIDFAYLLDVNDRELTVSRVLEEGDISSKDLQRLQRHEGISGMVWATGKSVIYGTKVEWEGVVKGYMPAGAESVLSVPILRSGEVKGVLFLASRKKRLFHKYQVMVVDILCSYLSVALENARHYEKTKNESERCALTKLYNYRYFERYLTDEFQKLDEGERKQLSLILLDIDYFKSINDTYGHQSGNEVLIELAERLRRMVGSRGTVARYGGEEFIVLLPDIGKEQAHEMAERIRQFVSARPFYIRQSMNESGKIVKVSITVSIGVSCTTDGVDDSLSLIRYADYAMYMGAKQKGRNRVADYQAIL